MAALGPAAPAYGPRTVVALPLDTFASDVPEQRISIIDTLRAWFG
jgi:hypothetical protein